MKERTNERKQPSQLDQILAVLESGGTLTALDALEDFGCSRLASRITDLKRRVSRWPPAWSPAATAMVGFAVSRSITWSVEKWLTRVT